MIFLASAPLTYHEFLQSFQDALLVGGCGLISPATVRSDQTLEGRCGDPLPPRYFFFWTVTQLLRDDVHQLPPDRERCGKKKKKKLENRTCCKPMTCKWRAESDLSKLSSFCRASGKISIKSLMSAMSAESLIRAASVSTAVAAWVASPRDDWINLDRRFFFRAFKTIFWTEKKNIKIQD